MRNCFIIDLFHHSDVFFKKLFFWENNSGNSQNSQESTGATHHVKYQLFHLICQWGNCPFTENFFTRKSGGKGCNLCGDSFQLANLLTHFWTHFTLPKNTTQSILQNIWIWHLLNMQYLAIPNMQSFLIEIEASVFRFKRSISWEFSRYFLEFEYLILHCCWKKDQELRFTIYFTK